MNNFIRKWATRALITVSAVLAPWLALAAYNIVQNPNNSTCFADSAQPNAVMCFMSGRVLRATASDGTGAETWVFDQKEYTIYLADLGTASSALFAVPTTGVISTVSVTWGTTLTSASAVMAMWRVTAANLITSASLDAAPPASIAAFSLTAPVTSLGGGRIRDDDIEQAVGMGDVIAIDTNGGPGNVVPGFITITITATRITP